MTQVFNRIDSIDYITDANKELIANQLCFLIKGSEFHINLSINEVDIYEYSNNETYIPISIIKSYNFINNNQLITLNDSLNLIKIIINTINLGIKRLNIINIEIIQKLSIINNDNPEIDSNENNENNKYDILNDELYQNIRWIFRLSEDLLLFIILLFNFNIKNNLNITNIVIEDKIIDINNDIYNENESEILQSNENIVYLNENQIELIIEYITNIINQLIRLINYLPKPFLISIR